MTIDQFRRFFAKVEYDLSTGCWRWIACSPRGYGQFWDGKRRVKAHRISYEHFRGRITKVLDHICNVRSCVNPWHLRDVSQRENNMAPSIGVEVDGHDFHEKTRAQVRRDKQRERAIVATGLRVLRFSGSELFRDACGCADEVVAALDALAVEERHA